MRGEGGEEDEGGKEEGIQRGGEVKCSGGRGQWERRQEDGGAWEEGYVIVCVWKGEHCDEFIT